MSSKNISLKEKTFAVQENREIFTFRGNKLSRMTSYEKFRGNKLSRILLKTAKPRKFLPLKYVGKKYYSLAYFVDALTDLSLRGALSLCSTWALAYICQGEVTGSSPKILKLNNFFKRTTLNLRRVL